MVSRLRDERRAVLPGERVPGYVCPTPHEPVLPTALQSPHHLSARETKAGELAGSPGKANFAALKDHVSYNLAISEFHKNVAS